MAFEDYSSIEEFRTQYHGNAYLRLLMRSNVGKQYSQIGENLTQGFFIGKDYSTREGKLEEILTIDFRYTPSLDPIIALQNLIAVDLVDPDETFKRYSVASNTPPSFSKQIYSQVINANFNDRNPITGITVPDPAPEPLTIFQFVTRYIHSQAVASAEWIINHNLGERPIVEVFSVGNAVIDAEVLHPTVNQARVYFTSPMAGSARCI